MHRRCQFGTEVRTIAGQPTGGLALQGPCRSVLCLQPGARDRAAHRLKSSTPPTRDCAANVPDFFFFLPSLADPWDRGNHSRKGKAYSMPRIVRALGSSSRASRNLGPSSSSSISPSQIKWLPPTAGPARSVRHDDAQWCSLGPSPHATEGSFRAGYWAVLRWFLPGAIHSGVPGSKPRWPGPRAG